jgi:drug/metabolite transporter (DMT)-like permease
MSTQDSKTPLALIIFVALVAVIVWGASTVATKIAVAELPPLAVAVLRTVIGGGIALVLALILRLPLPDTKYKRSLLLLSAGCGFVAFPVFLSIGVNFTSANHASIILASLPIFTAGIAALWDRRWPQALWWIGVAVALGGEFMLVGSKTVNSDQTASLTGDLIVLAGNLFASLGYVAGGKLQQAGYESTGTTFWGAGLAAIILLPILPFVLGDTSMYDVSMKAWSGVLYLAIGVTIVGYVMWYWALGKGGIGRIGLMQFLQPVSGVILAWFLLGETFGLAFIVASALVLAGTWIALNAKH